MSLVASHRNRDLTLLEQLSVGSDALGAAVAGGGSPVRGAVVLPTCNRFEVYLETDDPVAGRAAVIDQIERATALERDTVEAALATYEGDDAVQHLLSVATGLDSMVVGEREISGQVRRAHIDAQAGAHLSPLLDRLFQSALRTSRVVASSTGLGTSGRSVVSVAFDLASETVTWSGARAVVIGTGALAETGVGSLLARGVMIDGVFSPSGRAEEFGARHGIRPLDREGLRTALTEVDLVLACSGGESIVLTPAMVAAARPDGDTPLTIVDLALHRDVAPGVAQMRGVTVVNLESVGARAPEESVGAIDAARSIVAHAVARFGDGEHARSLDPAVVALREHVFGLLERELARVQPAAGASEQTIAQADATEQALRRFAKTLLHIPTVRAREHAQAGESDRYLGAIRALYGIDVAIQDDACPAPEMDAAAESDADPATHL
ncbi:glutamyl-tRNA reductase [Demequina aestuarii]|uniref:glutamyl-tRNA reductase n=1 Tax=Demequina aestuarii TaxID=327095 RepID=UPI000A978DA6|nr:glutamyl-tRNA reductase [Demequina aestuarii]